MVQQAITAAAEESAWQQAKRTDLMTGRRSISLGDAAYRAALQAANLCIASEYTDEGRDHYYHAVRAG